MFLQFRTGLFVLFLCLAISVSCEESSTLDAPLVVSPKPDQVVYINDDGRVIIAWEKVEGADSYQLEIVKDTGDTSFTNPANQVAGSPFNIPGNKTELAIALEDYSYQFRLWGNDNGQAYESIFHVLDTTIHVACDSADCIHSGRLIGNKSYPVAELAVAVGKALNGFFDINIANRPDNLAYESEATLPVTKGMTITGGFAADSWEQTEIATKLRSKGPSIITISGTQDVRLEYLDFDTDYNSTRSINLDSNRTEKIAVEIMASEGVELEHIAASNRTITNELNLHLIKAVNSTVLVEDSFFISLAGQSDSQLELIFAKDSEVTISESVLETKNYGASLIKAEDSTVRVTSSRLLQYDAANISNSVHLDSSHAFLRDNNFVCLSTAPLTAVFGESASAYVLDNRFDGCTGIDYSDSSGFVANNNVINVTTSGAAGITAHGVISNNSIASANHGEHGLKTSGLATGNVIYVGLNELPAVSPTGNDYYYGNTVVTASADGNSYGVQTSDNISIVGNMFINENDDFAYGIYEPSNSADPQRLQFNAFSGYESGTTQYLYYDIFNGGELEFISSLNSTSSTTQSSGQPAHDNIYFSSLATAFHRAPVSIRFTGDGLDSDSEYDSAVNGFELTHPSDCNKFIVGEYIEIGMDSVARQITSAQCASNVTRILFTPDMENEVPEGVIVALWGSVKNHYNRRYALKSSASAKNNVVSPCFTYFEARTFVWGSGASQGICDRSYPFGTTFNIGADECITEYLAPAIEIFDDGIGNDNGFCEEDEACLVNPNSGAYAGHGSLNGGSCYSGSLPPGFEGSVDLDAYESNGY